MVRDGHYPKFSEMIDSIEKIALQYCNFENYLDTTKNLSQQNRKDLEDILAGKKTIEDIEDVNDSTEHMPTLK